MQVSIIVVNYNTKDITENCIASIISQTKDVEYEIILVDNGFLFEPDELGLTSAVKFMNSDDIYNLYNRVINNIKGTKTASQHMDELMKIYKKIV